MESNEVFFPYQMLKCWKFGADSLETEESRVLETAGGSAIYLSQPQTPSGPLAELNHDCL